MGNYAGEGQLGVHMALTLAAGNESSLLGFFASSDDVCLHAAVLSPSLPSSLPS